MYYTHILKIHLLARTRQRTLDKTVKAIRIRASKQSARTQLSGNALYDRSPNTPISQQLHQRAAQTSSSNHSSDISLRKASSARPSARLGCTFALRALCRATLATAFCMQSSWRDSWSACFISGSSSMDAAIARCNSLSSALFASLSDRSRARRISSSSSSGCSTSASSSPSASPLLDCSATPLLDCSASSATPGVASRAPLRRNGFLVERVLFGIESSNGRLPALVATSQHTFERSQKPKGKTLQQLTLARCELQCTASDDLHPTSAGSRTPSTCQTNLVYWPGICTTSAEQAAGARPIALSSSDL